MGRDLVYEENNRGYSGQYPEEEGGGIKCKNYELCTTVLPPDWDEMRGNYLCITCDMFGWNELEFRDTQNDCAVCFECPGREMKFPACNHYFCVECTEKILFWDETRYHLSTVPYGCPPCPNGCENPIRGRQCYCMEYYGEDVGDSTLEDGIETSIVGEWSRNNKEQYEQWSAAENASIKQSEEPHSVYCSMKCPLCRRTYSN